MARVDPGIIGLLSSYTYSERITAFIGAGSRTVFFPSGPYGRVTSMIWSLNCCINCPITSMASTFASTVFFRSRLTLSSIASIVPLISKGNSPRAAPILPIVQADLIMDS